MPTLPATEYDRPIVYQLAAAADCDPRTAAKRLRGERVRGRPGERLERALPQLGLRPPAASAAHAEAR
jgi:hypothetical protein